MSCAQPRSPFARAEAVASKATSPAMVAFAVGALIAAFVGARLIMFGGDPSGFILPGETYCATGDLPGLEVIADSDGYDGQFYYRLARNPFNHAERAYGVRLAIPPYYNQRIAAPLGAWLLSGFGQPRAVPFALIALNALGLVLIGGVAARMARAGGRSAWWGLIVALYPGFLLTLSRSLPEIVGAAAGLLALEALRSRRAAAAAAGLSVAVLAKETLLLLAAATLAGGIWRAARQREAGARSALVAGAVAVGIWSLWQAALTAMHGRPPFVAGGGNIGPPLAGLAGFVVEAMGSNEIRHWVYLCEIALLFAFGAVVAFALWREARAAEGTAPESAAIPGLALAWALYAMLLVSLTRLVWVEDWAFLRASSEFVWLGWVIILTRKTSPDVNRKAGRSRRRLTLENAVRLCAAGWVTLWLFYFALRLTD